jgi:hypothetical protein
MKRALTAATLAAALVIASILPALARGTIAEVGIKEHTPAAGQHVQFQVALIASDADGLRAGDYSVRVELRNADGAQIAASGDVSGTENVTSDKGAVVIVPVDLPPGISGNVQLQAILLQAGAVAGRSEPQTIVIGGLALAPAAPAAAAAQPNAFSLTGNMTANENVAQGPLGQSGMLSLDGKVNENLSFSASGGVTSSNGGNKPVFTIKTKTSQLEFGTFAPSFDPMVFDGPSGLATSYRFAIDDKHVVQTAYVLGAQGTLNPFDVGAVNFLHPIGRSSSIAATLGIFKVKGEFNPLSGEPLPDTGEFFGLTLQREASGSVFGWGLHYGLQGYRDKAGVSRAGNAFNATGNLTTGKAAWTFDYRRTSPNYMNLFAGGVTPDRESVKLNVSVPLGTLTSSFGVSTDDDNLPGASLAQSSRAFSENLSLTLPFKNGDSLAYSFNGSTTHLGANLVVSPTAVNSASAGDGQNITYNAKRGDYTFSYTLGYTNQRDNQNNLQHVSTDGITVSRAVSKGLTFTTNVSLNTNVAANSASSNSGIAGTLGLGYVAGPVELSGSFGTSRSRPYLGLRPPDTSTMNLGLKLAQTKNFTIQGGFTQSAGAQTTQSGSINVTQKI